MTDRVDENRLLCSKCVGEAFLRSEMQKEGGDGVCFYCETEGKTFSIGEIAKRIAFALDQHFYRTATEPDGLEWAMMKEGDLDWERKGESIVDVIQSNAEIEVDIAEDIQRVLHERHYDVELAQMGEEQRFEEDAHYEEREVDDADSQAGWFNFERGLKTEARFFSRTAEWTLKSIFEGIGEHKTHDDRPIVIDAGSNTRIEAIYRARVFQSDEKLKRALERPDIGIGPPASRDALAGRMNPYGISVFYGATDPNIALAEVRPPVGSRVVVGRFDLVRPVRLLDIEALRMLNVQGSIFDGGYLERLEKAKFLQWLGRRIIVPIMPDDEPYDYLPTQAIADFLATNADPLLHGILYPSVQGSEAQSNVVLFHKAARVQPLEIPARTEISARLYDDTEDGVEINYWVSEQVPPPAPRAEPESIDLPFISEPLDQPLDLDDREPFLKLDTSSLEVHHVTGIQFKTESHAVHRHRYEKRPLKF